eukprot:TRINITY_DN2616_c0_g1_i1.p2 TRINITY_DN2616_c0_g1~~TRINITY_DN2616_c0_g1_i1.p2  ORF type:complete len:67 (+),score=13.82 TRINITY_DN2616_c0_g1_i1:234-434(+)
MPKYRKSDVDEACIHDLKVNNPDRLSKEVIQVEVLNQADKGFNSLLCRGMICLHGRSPETAKAHRG